MRSTLSKHKERYVWIAVDAFGRGGNGDGLVRIPRGRATWQRAWTKTGKRIGLAPLRRLKAQNASLRPFKSKPNVFHWDDKSITRSPACI